MSDQTRLLQLQGASPEYIAYCESCWGNSPIILVSSTEDSPAVHGDDDGAWDED